MFSYLWPIALVVLSNVAYHISSKSTPVDINPFASLTITYSVGAVFSLILYYALNRNANILHEYSKLNWASILLGLAIVGLEVGYCYAYRAGWNVSTAQIVQSAALAVLLIAVGYFLYHEKISWNQIIGILICLIGLYFINKQ